MEESVAEETAEAGDMNQVRTNSTRDYAWQQ